MTDDLQHCASCQEEYVAGVSACVECGGALQPGPLERHARQRRSAQPPAADTAPPSRLLVQLPGLQAHHTARALLREGIRCRAECAGQVKLYLPDQPPIEALAVTLPVSLYVDEQSFEAAQEILDAPVDDDAIGDQWAESDVEATDEDENDEMIALPMAPSPVPAGAAESVLGDDPADDGEPAAQSTSLRTVVLIVLAAIVLLFLFGR